MDIVNRLTNIAVKESDITVEYAKYVVSEGGEGVKLDAPTELYQFCRQTIDKSELPEEIIGAIVTMWDAWGGSVKLTTLENNNRSAVTFSGAMLENLRVAREASLSKPEKDTSAEDLTDKSEADE